MDRTIEYSPLFSPVSADDITTYRAELAARGSHQRVTAASIIGTVVVSLVALFVVAVIVLPAILTATVALIDGNPAGAILPALVPLGVVAGIAVLVVNAVRQHSAMWPARVRMHRFAQANGLLYEPKSAAPTYPGLIFGVGDSRAVTDHFRTTESRYLDFGNLTYSTGSGRSRTTHRWGFMALHLDRALPHMVLDSRRNNGMLGGTNLPSLFSRDQTLSLEGDFDQHFTLHCPREYERDALYVFTPDLMALLIDEAAPFDVEIVDRWMFVYAAKPFPLADATTYQRLLRIVSTVGAKTLTQTDRYVDERVGAFEPNLVAPGGQRLRKRFSWGSVALAVLLAIVIPGMAILTGLALR